jgi:hypothetical protein
MKTEPCINKQRQPKANGTVHQQAKVFAEVVKKTVFAENRRKETTTE